MTVLKDDHITLTVIGTVGSVSNNDGCLQVTFESAQCKFPSPSGQSVHMSFARRPLPIFTNQDIQPGDRVKLSVLWLSGREMLIAPPSQRNRETAECAVSLIDVSKPDSVYG